MEISSARIPTPGDRPRQMRRRQPGPPGLAGDQLTRTEEDAMDPHDAVSSHNREAWDAEVERGNRWTLPVDHQAIEAARRGRLEVLLTDSRAVPAAWFPDLDGADVLCLASGGQQDPCLRRGPTQMCWGNPPRQSPRGR